MAVVAALGLSACGGGSGGSDSAGSKTLRVTLVNHVWTDNIKKALPEFEKQSGLKVEVTQLGEDQLSDQYNVKLNAGSERHRRDDVPPPAGREAVRQEQVPRRPRRQGQGRQELGLERLPGRAGRAPPRTRTRWWACPIITEQEVLYYRKDLLKKAGLAAPPKTLDELKADVAKIEAANPGVAGFVARTGKSAAVTQFSSFLYSFGGDFIDGSGKATVNTAPGKAGLRPVRRAAQGPRAQRTSAPT